MRPYRSKKWQQESKVREHSIEFSQYHCQCGSLCSVSESTDSNRRCTLQSMFSVFLKCYRLTQFDGEVKPMPELWCLQVETTSWTEGVLPYVVML